MLGTKTEWSSRGIKYCKIKDIKESSKNLKQEVTYTDDSNEAEFDIEDKGEKYKIIDYIIKGIL